VVRRNYQFNSGSYAAEALADILTWLADLDDGVCGLLLTFALGSALRKLA
jgi:hypothetical protein